MAVCSFLTTKTQREDTVNTEKEKYIIETIGSVFSVPSQSSPWLNFPIRLDAQKTSIFLKIKFYHFCKIHPVGFKVHNQQI